MLNMCVAVIPVIDARASANGSGWKCCEVILIENMFGVNLPGKHCGDCDVIVVMVYSWCVANVTGVEAAPLHQN